MKIRELVLRRSCRKGLVRLVPGALVEPVITQALLQPREGYLLRTKGDPRAHGSPLTLAVAFWRKTPQETGVPASRAEAPCWRW